VWPRGGGVLHSHTPSWGGSTSMHGTGDRRWLAASYERPPLPVAPYCCESVGALGGGTRPRVDPRNPRGSLRPLADAFQRNPARRYHGTSSVIGDTGAPALTPPDPKDFIPNFRVQVDKAPSRGRLGKDTARGRLPATERTPLCALPLTPMGGCDCRHPPGGGTNHTQGGGWQRTPHIET